MVNYPEQLALLTIEVLAQPLETDSSTAYSPVPDKAIFLLIKQSVV
jgi:hypothetical protein